MANACQSMILESQTELNLLFGILDLGVDLYPLYPLAMPYLPLFRCPCVSLTLSFSMQGVGVRNLVSRVFKRYLSFHASGDYSASSARKCTSRDQVV